MKQKTSNVKRPGSTGSPPPKRTLWMLGAVALVVILAAVAMIMFRSRVAVPAGLPLSAPASATATTGSAPAAIRRPDPALGPDSAPVKIEEYGDLGCTTCRAWYQSGTLSRLRTEYGDKIQFIWHDYPIITAQSPKAAEAGQCAYDQGRFWEYHDLLYAHPESLYGDGLKVAAEELQLDTAAFGHCLDSHKYTAQINQNLEEGRQLKIVGTPTFIINHKGRLTGVPTFDNFVALIKQELGTQ